MKTTFKFAAIAASTTLLCLLGIHAAQVAASMGAAASGVTLFTATALVASFR